MSTRLLASSRDSHAGVVKYTRVSTQLRVFRSIRNQRCCLVSTINCFALTVKCFFRISIVAAYHRSRCILGNHLRPPSHLIPKRSSIRIFHCRLHDCTIPQPRRLSNDFLQNLKLNFGAGWQGSQDILIQELCFLPKCNCYSQIKSSYEK